VTSTIDIISPRARTNFLSSGGAEAQLMQALNTGALANGWLISGGEGIGKATLAFRLARMLLWPDRPSTGSSLEVPTTARASTLVAAGAHPDLFIAERLYDEKKERYAAEISIDTIRNLSHFLSHTASMGGWRVAIVDTADNLNRNSANALLKVLEEPPPKTAIFVLSAAPGRLLATIRSRCRRVDLRPLPDDMVADFLIRAGAATGAEAARIAQAAGGRPGFALSLALGDGAEAIEAVDAFWTAARTGADVSPIAQRLSGKNADGVWPLFQSILIGKMAQAAANDALAAGQAAGRLVDLRETVDTLFTRGEAVNLDRGQMVMAAGRAFRSVFAAA